MLQGETIRTGAPRQCSECQMVVTDRVYMNGSGAYYIGTRCDCGPYSRESGYFPNREEAMRALKRGSYAR